jgi:hypothetical protein
MGTAGEADLATMVAGGVAIFVVTASADGRPAITRGWGPRYDHDSSTITLAITAPASSPTLANLESGGAIAVTISEPLTYRTIQVKGTVEHAGAPSADDRARVQTHLERFGAEVEQLGVVGAERLFLGDLRVVSFAVAEMFVQTPGPDAGRRLR